MATPEPLESYFPFLWKNCGEGVLILDDEGKILYVNPRGAQILKISESEAKGTRFLTFIADKENRGFVADFVKQKPPMAQFIDVSLKKSDGTSCLTDLILLTIDTQPLNAFAVFFQDYTDQHRLITEKNQNEALLSNIFEAIEDGISLLDTDLNIVRVNPWMEKKYAENTPIVGKKCYEVYQQRKSVCPWCPSVRALETGKIQQAIVPYPSAVNPTGWMELYSFPARDKKGNVTGVVEYVKDITDRKKLEDALIESERRFRTFFENSAIFAYITTKDGEILEVNRAAVDLLGYKREELLSNKVTNLYANPRERERFIKEIEAKGFVKDFLIHLRRRDGSIITCLDTATRVKDSEGNDTLYQGVIRDITEQEAKERELARLYSLLEQTDIEVLVTDVNGAIEYVNPAFERVTGYSADEARGQTPRILKSGRHDEVFYKNLWDTITSGRPWHGRFYNKRKDGTFYHEETHLIPLTDSKGQITNFAAIKQDVTREVMLEEQLNQTAKLEAIGKLAGNIAHDFNNILTSIQGFAELGLSKVPPDSPSRNEFLEILNASKQASRITKQLLEFSRKQPAIPKTLSANTIIRDMIPLLEHYIGEDVQLTASLEAEKDTIIGDQGQFEQCILNLVINARDAIHEKNTSQGEKAILIETHTVAIDDMYLKSHTGIEEGSYVVVSVSDTGIGMDKETLTRIFEPFFTTKPQGKGTGLGCSTVFGIVKQNGGNIRVYSELGVGTTMKIYWPLVDHETEMQEAGEEGFLPQESLEGHETILVVEDDKGIREFVSQALNSFGYTVYSASDGKEALTFVEEKDISPHLLFADIIMPRMSGKELADTLAKRFKGLKILFTSGYTENQITYNGLLSQNAFFLHKPYTIRELIREIRTILDRS